MPALRRILLTLALVSVSLGGRVAGAEIPLDPDEEVLRKARIGTETGDLMTFFRNRSLTEHDRAHVEALVVQLGSRWFPQREKAAQELTAIGPPARPFLASALKDEDPEISRRASRCLEEIQSNLGATLPSAAARLLARRQAAGATELLLRYLPFADDVSIEEEVLGALVVLTNGAAKPDAALAAALLDPLAARRAAAAYVLGRLNDKQLSGAAQKLLTDREARVRLRAAQGLVAGKEKLAVPTLIGLLTDAPADVTWQAEDLLLRIAGDRPPEVTLSDASNTARQKYRDGWAAWWREQEAKVDLARLEQPPETLGLTLIVQMDMRRVWECGRDGQPRWVLENLEGPIDAQVLPGDRVLVAEFQGHKVTERDKKGNILWSKSIQNPVVCQRLPNGNTFIACYAGVTEVTRDGKDVYFHRPSDGANIYGAQRQRNGRIACVTLQGVLLEIDAASGRTVKHAKMNTTGCYSVEALSRGGFLVTSYNQGKVLEVDANGETVWECPVTGAYHASRLPNGNTLVSSHGGKRVLEITRDGKSAWEQNTQGHVWRVHRR